MLGVDAGKAHGRAVGVMHADVYVKVGKLLLEILHHSHLRVAWLIAFGVLGTMVEQTLPLGIEGTALGLMLHHSLVVGVVLGIFVEVAQRGKERVDVLHWCFQYILKGHGGVVKVESVRSNKTGWRLRLAQPAAR